MIVHSCVQEFYECLPIKKYSSLKNPAQDNLSAKHIFSFLPMPRIFQHRLAPLPLLQYSSGVATLLHSSQTKHPQNSGRSYTGAARLPPSTSWEKNILLTVCCQRNLYPHPWQVPTHRIEVPRYPLLFYFQPEQCVLGR